ncbi:MAG TPA: serine hydrolase, partial [Thermoanaerobaculia bacterium]|nr:serine hydrolase [Thermoanaerobaculia bacterium]
PFERFAKTRLFDPLGMRNTVISAADWSRGERAQSYRYDPARNTTTPRTLNDYATLGGAGAIKSSARDMAQWIRFQLNDGIVDGRRIVSAESLRETRKPAMVLSSDESAREDHPETNINTYGLGWRVQDYRGELQVWHSGALNGYRTIVNLLPRQSTGFVILSSLDRGYPLSAIRNALSDLMLSSSSRDWNAYYLAVEAKNREKSEKEKAERQAKRHSGTKPSRELEAYSGTYENAAHGPATVSSTDAGLVLKWARLTIPLRHFHFDTFTAVDEAEDLDEAMVFRLGADGSVASMELFGEEFRRQPTLTGSP